MSNEISIKDVVAALSKAVRAEHVQQKTLKGNQISFIPWHTAVRILNEQVPGWQGEVKQIIGDAGKVAVVYRLGIPCTEGMVWREAIGNEDEDKDGYGDPFSNAEAMAFKRAAAKFGLGLDLYRKGTPPPQVPAQQRKEAVTVRQLPELKPTFDDDADDFDRIPSGGAQIATEKQVKAVYAIGRAVKRWSESEVDDRSVEVFGVRPQELTKNEASQFIKQLQDTTA